MTAANIPSDYINIKMSAIEANKAKSRNVLSTICVFLTSSTRNRQLHVDEDGESATIVLIALAVHER